MKTKTLTITLPEEIWEEIEKARPNCKDCNDMDDSEIISDIIFTYLSKNGYLFDKDKDHKYNALRLKMDMVGNMLDSLREILQEKDIITYNEWAERMQNKIIFS